MTTQGFDTFCFWEGQKPETLEWSCYNRKA